MSVSVRVQYLYDGYLKHGSNMSLFFFSFSYVKHSNNINCIIRQGARSERYFRHHTRGIIKGVKCRKEPLYNQEALSHPALFNSISVLFQIEIIIPLSFFLPFFLSFSLIARTLHIRAEVVVNKRNIREE